MTGAAARSLIEHVVSVDGTRIGFERLGAGPPLVAVHGGTADRSRWAPVAPLLAERWSVLLVDRRGRGASGDNPDEDYEIGREAHDIAAVINAAGAPVMLLGHSYGAICALEAALLTDPVARMLLYEPAFATPGRPVMEGSVLDRLERLLADGDRDAALETFMVEVAGLDRPTVEALRNTPVWAARLAALPTVIREGRVANSYVPDPGRLAALTMPVRFLRGTESPDWARAATAAAHAAVPHSDLVELPGQGHVAMDTATQMFIDQVVNFFT